ncbi:MAG: DNA-binding protein [Clostridiales bacterium]|nr:DNA-binding protein [Clostridiales bacterium]
MKTVCCRLHRGEDLLASIEKTAKENHLKAAAVLSAVGCVSRARVRDAGGVQCREVGENCEIVSLMGTVSETRTHLHIALSKEDLSTVGGHLMRGCLVNTTCELVLLELDGWRYGMEQDGETGYDEIVFQKRRKTEEQ